MNFQQRTLSILKITGVRSRQIGQQVTDDQSSLLKIKRMASPMKMKELSKFIKSVKQIVKNKLLFFLLQCIISLSKKRNKEERIKAWRFFLGKIEQKSSVSQGQEKKKNQKIRADVVQPQETRQMLWMTYFHNYGNILAMCSSPYSSGFLLKE